MAVTPRLVIRGSVFYYRMAVPRDLVALVGKVEVKFSLRTSDRLLAKIRCRAISNHIDLIFREGRRMASSQDSAIDTAVRDYFKTELDRGVVFAEIFAPEPEVVGCRSNLTR